MSYGGGAGKNPPWVRQGQTMGMGVGQPGQMQPQMMPQLGNTAQMLQYPQAQMYQQAQLGQMQQVGRPVGMQQMGSMGANQLGHAGGLSAGMQAAANTIQGTAQLYPQVGTVSYPTRALITTPYGGAVSQAASVASAGPPAQGGAAGNAGAPKQRVFTGTVTKVQDNFGFVDEEVFFQTSCCVKGSNPQAGDRVLVEAVYNASMPFKWNATRIQVLPMDRTSEPVINAMQSTVPPQRNRFTTGPVYNSVPPPSNDILSGNSDFANRNRNNNNSNNNRKRTNRRERSNDEFDKKRKRDDRRDDEKKEKEKEKEKERPKSPIRKRSKSPRRKKRVIARYMVQIPKIALDMPEADVMEIKKRYTNLYVPSDFFVSSFKWVEVFPPHRPLTLERPCAFHVMHKDVEAVIENDAVLDPPDADYLFSAKVMLLSMPEMDEIFKRCCSLADDKEGSNDDARDFVHPTRMINFLVGQRGKNETMAIGGPWSPTLDGQNPDKDPTVLIKTAVRTCKALTGIDLTNCSQWYRFLEIYYHRAETVHKGKTVPARVETVVLYLPDVWNCQPTRLEWDGLHLNYKKALDRLLNQDEDAEGDDKDTAVGEVQKKEPTHYSQLDPKVMKVNELREELEARNLTSKGLKSQLTARLTKALKTEQEKEEELNAAKTEAGKTAKTEKEEKDEEKKKKEEEEKKKLDEKEKQLMEKRYTLPEKSHILVHPSRVAKSGKFDCTVMSLSLLLDYRPEDTKEHSFEVSLFAELFNEMLMRDFGFCIYKALVEAPEKPKEEKEDKDKKGDKDKKSDKDKKDGDDKDKKDDKKDDKNSVDDDDGSGDDDDSKKDKDRKDKKKDKVKLVTADPYLLLAFVYFDQTHCGYIFDKDLEELLFTLGLNLSRAQVKKLIQKIISRDSLHYRKLTDKPKEEGAKANGAQLVEDLMTLALGNKRLFPVFDEISSPSKRSRKGGLEKKQDSSDLPSGCVMYNGSLLDINKLQAQFKRSEETRLKTEKMLEKLRDETETLKHTNTKNNTTIKKLTLEVKDFSERLINTNSELCNMDAKTKFYFSIMHDIHEKLNPIVTTRPSKEETTIDDVEMEDAVDNEKRADPKQENSVTNEPKTAETMKTESPDTKPIDTKQENKVDVKTEPSDDTDQSQTDENSQVPTDQKVVVKKEEIETKEEKTSASPARNTRQREAKQEEATAKK